MQTRNPARVLPEPVGAAMSVSAPVALGWGGALGEPAPEPLAHGGVEAVDRAGRPEGELVRAGGEGGHPPIVPEGCDAHRGGSAAWWSRDGRGSDARGGCTPTGGG